MQHKKAEFRFSMGVVTVYVVAAVCLLSLRGATHNVVQFVFA